jgi:hypothetical protein
MQVLGNHYELSLVRIYNPEPKKQGIYNHGTHTTKLGD